MISSLKGRVIETGKNYVILGVNGVGYRVHMSDKVVNSLAENKGKVNVFTKLIFNQREGNFEIFGFLKKEELDIFELLTSISGIGPRGALNIISSIEITDLINSVIKDDKRYLVKISGLGPKTAQRLIVELKDKFSRVQIAKLPKVDLDQESDAIDALVSLGYTQQQAKEALKKLPKKVKGLEKRVKEALKILSNN